MKENEKETNRKGEKTTICGNLPVDSSTYLFDNYYSDVHQQSHQMLEENTFPMTLLTSNLKPKVLGIVTIQCLVKLKETYSSLFKIKPWTKKQVYIHT